jgi:hypothetical protein
MQYYWIHGHCGIEVNERAESEAKQAIKEVKHSQLLLPVADLETQRKKKGKKELQSFCQNTERERGERYFEKFYSNC